MTSVLLHDKHSLDGALLSVAPGNNTSALTSSEELQESRTIEVTGLAPTTTKDSIINYFENTRRSGGGEIEDVKFSSDKGHCVVTFVAAESKWHCCNS